VDKRGIERKAREFMAKERIKKRMTRQQWEEPVSIDSSDDSDDTAAARVIHTQQKASIGRVRVRPCCYRRIPTGWGCLSASKVDKFCNQSSCALRDLATVVFYYFETFVYVHSILTLVNFIYFS
jgi:hypothetical protein